MVERSCKQPGGRWKRGARFLPRWIVVCSWQNRSLLFSGSVAAAPPAPAPAWRVRNGLARQKDGASTFLHICTPSPEVGLCLKGCLGSISGGAKRGSPFGCEAVICQAARCPLASRCQAVNLRRASWASFCPASPQQLKRFRQASPSLYFARNTQNKKNSFLPFCSQKKYLEI